MRVPVKMAMVRDLVLRAFNLMNATRRTVPPQFTSASSSSRMQEPFETALSRCIRGKALGQCMY
jgi:hypothetical protein